MQFDTSGVMEEFNKISDPNNIAPYVELIELEKIKTDPNQPRKNFNQEDLDILADDIKTNGLLQPILVRPGIRNEEFIIIAGERRFRASKQAGLEKIPCILRNDFGSKAPTDIAKVQMSENVKRDNLKFWEIAEYIVDRIHKMPSTTQEELSKELGMPADQLSRYKSWDKAPDFLKEASKRGEINNIGKFYELISIETEEDLRDVLENANSIKQIREWKKRKAQGNTSENDVTDTEVSSSNDESPVSIDENQNLDFSLDASAFDQSSNEELFADESSSNAKPRKAPEPTGEYKLNLDGKKGKITSGVFNVVWADGSEEEISI